MDRIRLLNANSSTLVENDLDDEEKRNEVADAKVITHAGKFFVYQDTIPINEGNDSTFVFEETDVIKYGPQAPTE